MSLKATIRTAKKYILSSVYCYPEYFWGACSLYFITFVLVLPWLCSDWAFSHYMSPMWKDDELKHRALDTNRIRQKQAQKLLDSTEPAAMLEYYSKLAEQDDIELAIGVVTIRRWYKQKELGYLSQVMSQLHTLYKSDVHFPKKTLFMCNTYPGPGYHEEAERLAQSFVTIRRFPKEDLDALFGSKYDKEKQDYIFCVREALKFKPKYVLLIEDDAVPREELFEVLRQSLDYQIERNTVRGDIVAPSKQWAYFKLFYPDKWEGYGNEARHVFELIGIGALGGMLFILGLHVNIFRRSRHIPHRSNLLAFALGATYFVLICVLVGRQYILELRRLSTALYTVIPSPDCCSPSIVFPASNAEIIMKQLDHVKCSSSLGLDIAMDNFVIQEGYNRYLVEPNLFRHIGFVSSTKGPSANPAQFLF